eukprot:TRINITY_DN23507_c0_g1_i1.p1 TRINITY_DN23507_c0_g1~~TRINITY_DN23507_c0_g1_i1.p1  ORF type:complete len:358 (-),score=39.08 TRINITY_DN23507_c0_g1_i1:141-1214(-)
MDTYCIERGTLFDNQALSTLEYPNEHTIHCLVDVGSCTSSGFEVLADPASSGGLHCRAYVMDSAGTSTTIAAARAVGSCSTCTGAGSQVKGYRATIQGTVSGTGSPLPITVTAVLDESVGCGSSGNDIPAELNCKQGGLDKWYYAHGSLMLIGWGLLLPVGVILAKCLKHREGALWFQLHRGIQCFGLVLALAGWIIALDKFEVLDNTEGHDDSFDSNYSHAIMGCVTMAIGLLQPLNALIRPDAPEPGEDGTCLRSIWEVVHKGLGYVALILAVLTISVGTTLLPKIDDQERFQIAYGCIGGLLLITLILVLVDKYTYHAAPQGSDVDPNQEDGKQTDVELTGKVGTACVEPTPVA